MKNPLFYAAGIFVFCWLLAGHSAHADCPVMTRDQIANLAKSGVGYSYWWGHGRWRTDGAYHGSCSGSCPNCTHSGSYGADCSGFAAKVWQVPRSSAVTEDYHPYSTYNFRYETPYWTRVSRGSTMYRGDALVYNSDGSGHIMIYDSGNAWGTPIVWECKGCSYGCVHGSHSVSTSYIGIRRKNLNTQPAQGTLQGVVYLDKGVGEADMSERLGGASVSAGGKSTTARDGDAFWSFSLDPGSYTVTASKSGYLTNSRACKVEEGGQTWCSIGLAPACTPDCAGKNCGPDGCGGICGSCSESESCLAGQCVCQPQCGDRTCGPDPVCGSSCGTCAGQSVCDEAGRCVCVPDCSARLCGPDPLCGVSCGQCAAGQVCDAQGRCVPCQPDCSGLACGPDPACGISCGACSAGEICRSGQCLPCEKDCSGRSCGQDLLCGESCGRCPAELYCDAAGNCQKIPAGRGKLYGLVVAKPESAADDLHLAPAVPGAEIRADGQPQAAADEQGYFEMLLAPGKHALSASAEGYRPGSAECEVSEGAASECLLVLEKTVRSLSEEESAVIGGCQTVPPGSPLTLLALALPLLRRRTPTMSPR